jgi:tetratricopeptide (TPR) repeat protein
MERMAADRTEITGLPFFPQEDYQCGPAALAMAMQAAGAPVTSDDLVTEVFLPARHGSLQPEMMAAPRRHGLVTLRLAPRLRDVLDEVADGNPVVVLQNLAFDWYPVWHYAVVIGYDLGRGEIVLSSGRERRQELPLTTFERTWARSGYWAMLALSPRKLPKTAAAAPYLSAVIALERAGRPADARAAYEAALGKWPDNLTALMGLGNTAYELGDPDGSERAFRRAADLHAESDAALNNLAQVLADEGRFAEAQSAVRRALALDGPNRAVAERTLHEIREKIEVYSE